jgi:hypothetical protein
MKKTLLPALSLLSTCSLHALTLDMQSSPAQPPGTQYSINQYVEKGFRMKPTGMIDDNPPFRLTRNGGGIPLYPENGGAYLQLLSGNSFVLAAADGSAFNITSMDIAEYSTVFQTPATASWRGYFSDDSFVDVSFTTDGFIDGISPGIDFERFYFPPSFTGIVRLEATNSLFSFDNIEVSLIPEPSIFPLMLGSLAPCLWRFRRKK